MAARVVNIERCVIEGTVPDILAALDGLAGRAGVINIDEIRLRVRGGETVDAADRRLLAQAVAKASGRK